MPSWNVRCLVKLPKDVLDGIKLMRVITAWSGGAEKTFFKSVMTTVGYLYA